MSLTRYCLFLIFCLLANTLSAQEPIYYHQPDVNLNIGDEVYLLEDKDGTLTPAQAINAAGYKKSDQEVPNMQITPSAFWIKFSVKNSAGQNLMLELPFATIDSVTFVGTEADGSLKIIQSGEFVPYYSRPFKHQNYIFPLDVLPNETKTFMLRVKAAEQLQAPLTIGTQKSISESLLSRDLIFGLYAGIILVMFFYNLFVYFTVKDSTYLYYVSYIFAVGFTQACVQGYAARYFYPNSPYLANMMMVLIPALSGVTALAFLKKFLQVRRFTSISDKIINGILVIYAIAITMGMFGQFQLIAQNLVQLCAMIGSIVVLVVGVKIARKGYRPAKFFLIAWSVFLAGVIVFVLRNFGVLPYNDFTYYSLQIGSALESILLSFALADKINTFRKEKEESQAQTLQALEENARIVREQNVILETKVTERTMELKISNEELNRTLHELKEKEMQLVESEKMASLGQLTAGIAHEINNPINFVTSNVKPLKRDVEMIIDMFGRVEDISMQETSIDNKKEQIEALKEEFDFDYLKTEIDFLLKGITEGSTRTAEIVKGLRIFSRLDEDDLKKASINEGLDSTIIIVNNLLEGKIEIEKEYGNVPLVECYPGKLNQVFLNMITNAIHAIRSRYQGEHGGKVSIATYSLPDKVAISIKDNGTGMDEQTKKKLFEPFFTTKEVGEGTGLGLSIAYNTIKKHNGTITVNSELGQGTEFIIELPIIQE